MVSATEAVGGDGTEKVRREAGEAEGPLAAPGHPCEEQMGGRRQEREAKKG